MKNDAHILIAGAGGVLGRQIADALHKKGIRVSGVAFSGREFEGIRHKFAHTF